MDNSFDSRGLGNVLCLYAKSVPVFLAIKKEVVV
jgi:hypothetical protein